MAATAAFLEPLTATLPRSGCPPSTTKRSAIMPVYSSRANRRNLEVSDGRIRSASLCAGRSPLTGRRARRPCRATAAAHHLSRLQTHEGPLEGCLRLRDVAGGLAGGELLLGAAARLLGPRHVDLLAPLRGVGQDGHAVVAAPA